MRILGRTPGGALLTDEPIGEGELLVYCEDFPDLLLEPGDTLLVKGATWQRKALAISRKAVTTKAVELAEPSAQGLEALKAAGLNVTGMIEGQVDQGV